MFGQVITSRKVKRGSVIEEYSITDPPVAYLHLRVGALLLYTAICFCSICLITGLPWLASISALGEPR